MAELTVRESRVLRQLRAGKVATSIKTNMADPRIAEIAAICGFDCVWTCMEHVPNDYYTIENIVRAAKTQDVDVLTRVAKGCYPYSIAKYCQSLGVKGIGLYDTFVHVDTRENKYYWRTNGKSTWQVSGF